MGKDLKTTAIATAREARDLVFPEFKDGFSVKAVGLALTGIAPLSAAVQSGTKTVADGAGLLSHMSSAALSQPTGDASAPLSIADDKARFARLARLRGWLADDLAELQSRTHGGFLQFLALAIAALVASASTFYRGFSSLSMTCLLAAIPFLASAFRSGFHNFQIRNRTLCGVKNWISQPSQWWPLPLILLACLFASNADAQAVQTLTNAAAATDEGAKWLAALVPTDGNTSTPLTLALGQFNSWAMSFAVAMLAWHTVAGTVSTAHEGKYLGSRWHQTWAPIRVCIGMAFLATIPGYNGLNGAQQGVMLVANVGNSSGNQIWSTFSNAVFDAIPLNPAAQDAPVGQGLESARKALAMETCLAATNLSNQTAYQQAGWILRNLQGRPLITPRPSSDGVGQPNSAYLWDYGACGQISLPPLPSTANVDQQTFFKARQTAFAALVQAVQASKLADQMAAAKQPGAQQTNGGWPQAVVSPLLSAASAYDTAVQTAAQAYEKSRMAAMKSTLTGSTASASSTSSTATVGCGWLCAGEYFRLFSDINRERIELESESAAFNFAQVDEINMADPSIPVVIPADLKFAYSVLAELAQQWKAELAPLAPTVNGAALASVGDRDADAFTRIANAVFPKSMLQSTINTMTNTGTTDPVGSMINIGNYLLVTSQAILGIGATVAIASGNIIGNSAGAAAAFQFVSPWIHAIIGAMLIAGATHALLIPLLPMLYMVWGGITWIILVAEALVGATILAAMFVRMDGQELVDNVQRPGLMMLLALLVRPALQIFGFAFVFSLIVPVENFIDIHFGVAYTAATSGHFAGLFVYIVGVLISGWLHYQVWTRICSLITVVPDRVLAWIGTSGAESLGAGRDAESSGEALRGGIAGGFAGAASGSLSKVGGGGGGAGGGGGQGGIAKGVRGGAGAEPWMHTSGGYEGLSEQHKASAEKSYAAWSKENPELANKYGLNDYVSYVQDKAMSKRK